LRHYVRYIMLSLSQKFLNSVRRANVKLAALMGIVTSQFSDERHTQGDWEAGSQEDATGVPATSLSAQLSESGATASVSNTSGFTCASGGDPAYLLFTDGTHIEVASYTGSTGATFTGLVRGLCGAAARQWNEGDTVKQFVIYPGINLNDPCLEIQPKNWTQPDQNGAGGENNRYGARMVFCGSTNCFYVFGGCDDANYYNDLYKFDPATDTWSLLTPSGGPPEARAYHSMIYRPGTGLNDQIWVAGGRNATEILATAWKYQVSNNTWIQGANFPEPHVWCAMTAYVPSLGMVVAGGVKALNPGVTDYDNKCHSFDGFTWFRLQDMSNPDHLGAFGAACFMTKENIMLVVGMNPAGAFWADAYDPTLDNWRYPGCPIAYPPIRRNNCTLCYDELNNRAIMFAGESNTLGDPCSGGSKDLFIYNPETNAWSAGAPFDREARTQHCAAWNSAAGEMLVWGGLKNSYYYGEMKWPTYKSPMRFRWYWRVAKWRSDALYVGQPAGQGEWILEDSKDTVRGFTSVAYTGEYSDDSSQWTNIGAISDGDVIGEPHPYWRIHVTLTNDGLSDTPRVRRLDALFDTLSYFSFASRPVGDYPPIVKTVSSLASQADLVKCAAGIGGLSFGLLNTSRQIVRLVTDTFLRNKTVKIKIGVLDDNFDLADFQLVFKGRIENWDFDGATLNLSVADFLGDLKKDIPQEDEYGAIEPLIYSEAGVASNPVDIMIDILSNRLNVPDRDIDFNSFAAVKADQTLQNWKFNRTITDPTDSYDLMTDICRHIGAILIPRENGKIALKILKGDDSVADSWNDLDNGFKNVQFKGNGDSIRNFVSTWYGNDGQGDGWEHYGGGGAAIWADADSIENWGECALRTMSKWLGAAGAPYHGDQLACDISQRILDMSKNGIPTLSLETNISAFPIQIGDLIRIRSSVLRSKEEYMAWQRVYDPCRALVFAATTGRYSVPYLVHGCSECIDKKWWVTKKQVDFVKGTIKWELARAKQAPLSRTFTSRDDFHNGAGNQVDLDTAPGSVRLAIESGETYFESGAYELVIDMDQQPDDPGKWTLLSATPSGASIAFEAWASELGLFQGEQTPLGAVTDEGAITTLTRYYKIRATLHANNAKTSTPRLDEITISFVNG